jgi:hypothetical protein
MGFHRRYITKETILRTKQESLDRLFTADAFVFDTWSGKFYQKYKEGLTKEQILKILTD